MICLEAGQGGPPHGTEGCRIGAGIEDVPGGDGFSAGPSADGLWGVQERPISGVVRPRQGGDPRASIARAVETAALPQYGTGVLTAVIQANGGQEPSAR